MALAPRRPLLRPLLLLLLHRLADFGALGDEYCCPQHDHTHAELWEAIEAMQGWMILHIYERGDLNLEDTNSEGLTPLFYCSKAGEPDMVKLFLNLGANLEALDPATSMTPLFDCVRRGYYDICKMLLEAGADPNANDAVPLQPIWYAAQNGWYMMVKLLLDFNATVEGLRDYRNYGPLSLAAIKDRHELAELLLDNGADPMVLKEEVPNYKGKLSVISVCHKPDWLPETPVTGKCQEWQPGFIITLEAILKAHAFYEMVELLEDRAGLPRSSRAITYVGSGVDGSGTQGI